MEQGLKEGIMGLLVYRQYTLAYHLKAVVIAEIADVVAGNGHLLDHVWAGYFLNTADQHGDVVSVVQQHGI